MLSPDEVRALMDRHRWQPGEREEMQRDIAERAALDDGSQWAGERTAETKITTAAQPEATMVAPAELEAWVRDQIQQSRKASEAAIIGGVADAMGDLFREARTNAETEIAVLRAEVTALKAELVELRAESKLRGSLDDMQARLAQLEAPPLSAESHCAQSARTAAPLRWSLLPPRASAPGTPHRAPADCPTDLAFGSPSHAYSTNSCPAYSASEGNLRGHGLQLRERCWRHGLR